MNSSYSEIRVRSDGFAGVLVLVLLGVILALVLLAYSFLGVGSHTRALRDGVLSAVDGRSSQKVALNVGWCTTAAARLGARCFELPPEACAVIDSLQGAELGVYSFAAGPRYESARVLSAADQTMALRGWERVLGVSRRGELVGVYVPREIRRAGKINCCLVVLREQQLVVANAKADLRPLLELAVQKHPDYFKGPF